MLEVKWSWTRLLGGCILLVAIATFGLLAVNAVFASPTLSTPSTTPSPALPRCSPPRGQPRPAHSPGHFASPAFWPLGIPAARTGRGLCGGTASRWHSSSHNAIQGKYISRGSRSPRCWRRGDSTISSTESSIGLSAAIRRQRSTCVPIYRPRCAGSPPPTRRVGGSHSSQSSAKRCTHRSWRNGRSVPARLRDPHPELAQLFRHRGQGAARLH